MARKRSLKKRLLSSAAAHFILSFLVSCLMRFIFISARIEKHYPPNALPYLRGEKPAIFCFWHGRLIMQSFLKPPRRSMAVLMSQHNDGALITAVMRWFRIGSVRGSQNRGSQAAVLRLLAITERGGNLCITPDGPRGPFQKAAPGAAFVAMKTGYPILSIAFSASRHWRLKSWDKFMIPKPFSRIVYTASEPLLLVAGTSDEELAVFTRQMETQLIEITAQADRACGVAV